MAGGAVMTNSAPPLQQNVAPELLTNPDLVAQRLAQHQPRTLEIDGFRRAGVLVPLLETPEGLQVLFTVRAANLKSHAGDVAFPGGRQEEGETSLQAALRETAEEVGLEVNADQVLGQLSDHPSPARYVATPYVARVPWPQPLTLNTAEVHSVFTVPLEHLATVQPQTRIAQLNQYRRLLYAYPWQDYSIWGFTGNVVRDLLQALAGTASNPDAGRDPFDPD